jgi:phosphoribosylformylglycinamidine cyclo-ligase
MRRVFNLGVGFCVVVADGGSERVLEVLRKKDCPAWRIGTVVEASGVSFE